MKRRIEARGHGGRQADTRSDKCHRREQLGRLKHAHLPGFTQVGLVAAAEGIEQHEEIDEEQPIELALFEDLGDFFVTRRIERVQDIAFRMPPAAIVVPGRAGNDKTHEMHLTIRHDTLLGKKCLG